MTRQAYRYRESGLDNVMLLNGFEFTESPYGKGVIVQDLEGLHECIARTLIEKPTKLTGAEFRFLRNELDLSQKMLGDLFGRGERQVRNWETNRNNQVEEPYNRLIRHMYLECRDPGSTYVGLVQRLKNMDREWHRQIRLKTTRRGWQAAA